MINYNADLLQYVAKEIVANVDAMMGKKSLIKEQEKDDIREMRMPGEFGGYTPNINREYMC